MTANGNAQQNAAALILKNKGHQITLYAVEYDPQDETWDRKVASTDDDGNPVAFVEEKVWIKWTADEIADAEEKFGSLALFEEAMNNRPTSAIRWSLARILGRDDRAIGKAMIPERGGEYATVLGVLMSIANGVDPTLGPELLKLNFDALKKALAKQDETLRTQVEKAGQGQAGTSPGTGTDSSPTTSEPVETPTDSGAEALPRSSTS